MKMTLVEFLLARFAETEAEARRMQQRAQDHEAMIRTHQTQLLGRLVPGWHDWPDVQRMAAYVIADIEAKRRIVAREVDSRTKITYRRMMVLQDLALPYIEHPDFREEWVIQ